MENDLNIMELLKFLGFENQEISDQNNSRFDEFKDLKYLISLKKNPSKLEQLFYCSILLPETNIFKRVKFRIRLKVSIIRYLALNLGYRI